MSSVAEITGVSVGSVALIGAILFVLFCMYRKKNAGRKSETSSSEGGRTAESTETSLRRFAIEELLVATKDFSSKSLIGRGKFGEVHMGLLNDGRLVAIKKREGTPSPDFVDEVRYLSSIEHRNIVSLLGYCQEGGLQVLVYEYISNGNVLSHLSGERLLDFKLRLSIALGAAKGLSHIHSLRPRMVHKSFRTENVLLNDDFTPEVADIGIHNFVVRGPGSSTAENEDEDGVFLAPDRAREFRHHSEKGDVYSYGVFLLQLITGREPVPDELIRNLNSEEPVVVADPRMSGSFTREVMAEVMKITVECLRVSPDRRPPMNQVVARLEHLLGKEIGTILPTHALPTVTPGSHLFQTSLTL